MRIFTFMFTCLLIGTIATAEARPTTKQAETSYKAEKSQEFYGITPVLSEKDQALYKKMFRYQRAGMRDKVVELLPQLSNGVLMGHLIAERLLHPRTRASYKDLQKWLSRYNDQSPANDIYKLANKRKTKGAWHKKPTYTVASIARYSDIDAKKSKPQKVQNTSKRKKMLRTLKYYRQKQHYTKAMNLLLQKRTRKLLGEDTWAQVSVKLSNAMISNNYYTKAHKLSSYIANHTEMRKSAALWAAGFSAYLKQHPKTAAAYFRRLAYAVPVGSKYFSKGAYWAAKSYKKAGEKSIAKVFYNLASRDEDSFYGKLALQHVDKKIDWKWKVIPAIKEEEKKVLYKDKTIRRVIALAQIGERSLAQEELKTLNGRLAYDLDPALLALSVRLGLPNTSITLGYNMKERGKTYHSALYPTMRTWKPAGGYTASKALMHAVARQESAFKPEIKSRVGARGLMQVMPSTARYIRKKMNKPVYSTYALNKPYVNLSIGQDYILYLSQKMDGNLIQMIAAYNAGPGNVKKWVNRKIGNGDPLVFVERIPFEETRTYVQKVLRNYWMYQNRFGEKSTGLVALTQSKWPSFTNKTAQTAILKQ